MITPNEKAKELLWKYLPITESWKYENSNMAKKCALIAVDEILIYCSDIYDREFMEKVKQEIEIL